VIVDDSTLALLVLKMTALLVAGAAVAATLRRSSAGARHLVWLATLAGLLVLPAALRYAPLQLPILPRSMLDTQGPAMNTTPEPLPRYEHARRVEGSSPAVLAVRPAQAATSSTWLPVVSLRQGLLAAWACGAALLLGYLAVGVLSVRRIIRSAQPLDAAPWTSLLADVADRLDLTRLPTLLASHRASVPFAFGPWRPTVVLPAEARDWTEERRALVLSHELAHLKRRDLAGHALGRAACALYWFHPLVWAAARRLRAESERACDDLVLGSGVRASDYADHLLDILVAVRHNTVPGAAVAMARRKEFEGRVLAILDPARHRNATQPTQVAALLAGLATVFVAVAASAPSRAEVTPPTVVPTPAPTSVVAQAPAPRPEPVRDRGRAEAVSAAISAAKADAAKNGDGPEPLSPDRRGALVRVLHTDSEASVRRTAAWALAGNREADAIEALAAALHGDASAEVRETAGWALGQGDEGGVAVLGEALRRDSSPEVRATAAWALGRRPLDDLSPLLAALSDTVPEVREAAIWGVGSQRVAQAPEAVVTALRDADDRIRLVTAWALGQIGDHASIVPLKAAFKQEKDGEVRRALFHALYLIGERSPEVAEWAMASKDKELREMGVEMLAAHSSGPRPWRWPRPDSRPVP
jgi:beta-lactamase regulating signal transducer with metallopeptidase domain/HEAT repeat protein